MTLEHKPINTHGSNWIKICESCRHEFQVGEVRHEWRMQFDSSEYLNGSFWTRHCEECFTRVLNEWKNDMTSMLDKLEERR